MSVIWWRTLTASHPVGLCATCTWGLVRAGFNTRQETFCRLITPNVLVPFPVKSCTGYVDRRSPGTDVKLEARKIAFVTELKL